MAELERLDILGDRLFKRTSGPLYDDADREGANIIASHGFRGLGHSSVLVTALFRFVFDRFQRLAEAFQQSYVASVQKTAGAGSAWGERWLKRKLNQVWVTEELRALSLAERLAYGACDNPEWAKDEFRQRARELRQRVMNEIEIAALTPGTAGPVLQTGEVSLLELPKRDALLEDLEGLLDDKGLVAIAFIDLDGFKAVNDSYGHKAGDECLEATVKLIGSAIQNKGRLYRYGGDEFVVALPNFDTSEALATAERIRRGIDEDNPGQSARVTASIGVASSAECGEPDAASLLDVADKALYVSKNGGKNRVTVWPISPGVFTPRPPFEGELISGSYTVYVSNRPESPFVDVLLNVRVHNRRAAVTTVWCERLRLSLPDLEDGFPFADLAPFGEALGLEHNPYIQVAPNETTNLSIWTRKHYPYGLPPIYEQRQALGVTAQLKETHGEASDLIGSLGCAEVVTR